MDDLTRVLVAALPGLVGGALGAWVAAFFAFRRFKRERAFDLRADWYRRAFAALMELSVRLGEFQRGLVEEWELTELETAGLEIANVMERAGNDIRDVVLFGDSDSVKAVGRVGRAMRDLHLGGKEDVPTDEIVRNAQATRQVVFDAAMAVAMGGRKHLGLGPSPGVVMQAIGDAKPQAADLV